MEYETFNDLQTLRAAAILVVEELRLDSAVRNASKLGRFDGTANYDASYVTGEGKRIRIQSTHNAGTNSALVCIDEHQAIEAMARGNHQALDLPPALIVYRADDYGKALHAFRVGWWVSVVMDLAFQHICAQAVQRVVSEDQQRAREALAFSPLPG